MKTYDVSVSTDNGHYWFNQIEGDSAEAVLEMVRKKIHDDPPTYYPSDEYGVPARIEVCDDDSRESAEWESEERQWANARRWHAAELMLATLKSLREWATQQGDWEAPCWQLMQDAIAHAETAGIRTLSLDVHEG
jgi:hypothetical protein